MILFVHIVNYLEVIMEKTYLKLIRSWVSLSAMLKNSRFTKELSYNEAIIMLLLYEAADMPVSIKEITANTHMLKSQVNRTINALEEQGLLERCTGQGDRRVCYVRLKKDKLELFLQVHNRSMEIARQISDIIGPEDTENFIRIADKMANSGYHL